MIIDCRSQEFQSNSRLRRRVFIDGTEIHGVFYVDDELGIVRTYHVVEDADVMACAALSRELEARGVREGWDMPLGGVVSKTLYGKVELRPW